MTQRFPKCKHSLMFFCTLVAFFFLNCQVNAESGLYIDADRQLEYADQLFESNEYTIAANEYMRFVHFFPDDERVKNAVCKTGVSYFMGGQHQHAVSVFRDVIDKYQNTDVADQASFMMSRSYLAMGEAGSAVNCLSNLVIVTEDSDLKDRGFYEIGWIYLENPWAGGRIGYKNGYEVFPESGAADTAQKYFQKISGRNKEKYRIDKLSSGIDRLQSSDWKNPVLAGSLSVIPGVGQTYCGRYQDGIVALVLNTAFIFSAYESFTNDSPVLGGLISFVGAGFYMGNIYGAVSDAHKYNRRLYRYQVDDLRGNFRVELTEKGKKPAVKLSFKTIF